MAIASPYSSSEITALPNAADRALMDRIHARIGERFDARMAVDALVEATGGELYLCGGAVRRALFGDGSFADLDFMIPNYDQRAFRALDTLRVPYSLNSHHHRRYRWNGLELDLFEPREFFEGYDSIASALRTFDLAINAIAVHLGRQQVIDPFGVLQESSVCNPGINWVGWTNKSAVQTVVLAIRLAKILYEEPRLVVPSRDRSLLSTSVLPLVRACDWNDVARRFPPGKERFLEMFADLLRRGLRTVHVQRNLGT